MNYCPVSRSETQAKKERLAAQLFEKLLKINYRKQTLLPLVMQNAFEVFTKERKFQTVHGILLSRSESSDSLTELKPSRIGSIELLARWIVTG